MAKRVLVTGGAGFIGSHLVERLLAEGYSVRVLDNLSAGKREWVPAAAELIVGDIRTPETCCVACEGCEGVFHLAAMSRSAPSLNAIETCTENNIVGTQNVLMAARQARVRKVVYSGSATYYGNQPAPHREDIRGDFLNAYALSKYVGEQYCLMFDRQYGVPSIVLRYFSVYGPRQPETGVYALVMGIFLRQLREGRPLTIHGDGSQRRDFVHVRDVADANLRAFESDVHAQVFNVGSGSSASIRELADLISPDQVLEPRRAADAEVTLADIQRIQKVLGWEPRISLPSGLAELKHFLQAEGRAA